jgi:hypothetical protein
MGRMRARSRALLVAAAVLAVGGAAGGILAGHPAGAAPAGSGADAAGSATTEAGFGAAVEGGPRAVPAGTRLLAAGQAKPVTVAIPHRAAAGARADVAAEGDRSCTVTVYPVVRNDQTLTASGDSACGDVASTLNLAVLIDKYDGHGGPEFLVKGAYYAFPGSRQTPPGLPVEYQCGTDEPGGPYFIPIAYIHVVWNDGTASDAQVRGNFVDLGSC